VIGNERPRTISDQIQPETPYSDEIVFSTLTPASHTSNTQLGDTSRRTLSACSTTAASAASITSGGVAGGVARLTVVPSSRVMVSNQAACPSITPAGTPAVSRIVVFSCNRHHATNGIALSLLYIHIPRLPNSTILCQLKTLSSYHILTTKPSKLFGRLDNICWVYHPGGTIICRSYSVVSK
jgi:hypothetical protein